MNANRHSWMGIWIDAIKPTHPNYPSLASERRGTVSKAFLWITLSSVFSMGLALGRQFLVSPEWLGVSPVAGVLAGLGAGVFFALVRFVLLSLGSHLIALGLGGRAKYRSTLYVFSAFLSPLGFLEALLGLIEFSIVTTLGLQFWHSLPFQLTWVPVRAYEWFLAVAATMAIYGLNGKKALVATVPFLISGLAFVVLVAQGILR